MPLGVCAVLPVPGVTFILGNDLAEGNVREKSYGGVPPIVVPVVVKMENLFPACAITRAKEHLVISDIR